MPPIPRALRLVASAAVLLLPLFLHAASAPALSAFSLPWSDASEGVTNLASWQEPIPVDAPFVEVDAASHYSWKGKRLRVLGVNVTAGSAFPSHASADAHAARLARFGINGVRFHHLEAPWEPNNVLVDYSTGGSRSLSSDRLDKLHYFVAALAQKGVFSNINLLVSRQFSASDGLGSEITQLSWKDQQILGFFNASALALQKEYATQLLTAANPHRAGHSLAQDPAVMAVEILNENGLLQKWYEGVLDTLPATYAAQLRTAWNTWLRTRYASTAEVLTAWGALDVPLGAEKLVNGGFANGTASWVLEQHSGAAASVSVTSDFSGQASARISVTTPASTGWHLQFNQAGLSLEQGQVYTLSFWAKASVAGARLSAGIGRAHTDYAGLSPYLSPTLGTAWTQYQLTFQSGVNESNARFNLSDFGGSALTLWIAGASLKPGGKLGTLGEGISLESGNVPNTLRKPTGSAPSTAQTRDWMAFCLSLERAYWDTMKAHIKDTLGYRGVVWGTIISNSPPNTQAGLDAMDSHAYWQHPSWPAGLDWDPVQWTLPNVAMVNSPIDNTLAMIARQRVAGYPHNVTEYQHPSPNSYSGEGPLLSAAIGALQDWDSLWFFEYGTGTAEHVNGFFDMSGHPSKLANTLVAAALFRRGDLRAARREHIVAQTPATELNSALTKGGAWSIADGSHLGVPAALAPQSRLLLAIGEEAEGLAVMPTAPSESVLESDTAQLRWDTSVPGKGVVTVDAPLTKMLTGFPNGRRFELSGVSLVPGALRLGWCSLSLVMTEGRGFAHAGGGRILVVATGDQENTGQVWKDSTRNSVGSNWGRAPVLVEPVQAEVELPVEAARVNAWALDVRGQRLSSVVVTQRDGKAVLSLGGNGTTLWYEVVVAPVASAVAPVITAEPLGTVVGAGQPVSLSAGVEGWPTPVLQWYKGDIALIGANTETLHITSFAAGDEGLYKLSATNGAGTVWTRQAQLVLPATAASDSGRLVNVSTRAEVRTGEQAMVAGFWIEGTRDVLLRAIGPRLADFKVPNVLPDPTMRLEPSGGGAVLATVDNWIVGDTAMTQLFDRVKAFGLASSDKESCHRIALPSGGFTATVTGVDGSTGNGMVEVYDLGEGAEGRLLNLSTRSYCDSSSSDYTLILGFSITGTAPKKVLIRGVGPTLVGFGVASGISDPRITLHEVTPDQPIRVLRRNDDWGDDGATPALAASFEQTHAFALPTGSRDAGLCLWLEPGLYTVTLESKAGAGVGMVELYEVR